MRNRWCILVILLLLVVGSIPSAATAKSVEELRAELQDKRDRLKDAEAKIQKFKQDIQLKKQEARTLASQIDLIDDNIGTLELSLDRTLAEIEKTTVEIEEVTEEIKEKEAEIEAQKRLLAEYIRSLNSLDQQSTVSVLLKYSSFSEVIQEASIFSELQGRAQETLNTIQSLRDELEAKRRDLQDFKETLNALRRRQEEEQKLLANQRESKQRLLSLTNAQEKQFKELLSASQQAHQEAESEISRLDTLIREELRKQGYGNLPSVGVFDWPVTAIFGTSCEFHCAGYPYAYLIGPHSGIDIPTYVGTAIRAPADGYVARVHDAHGPGYSYILLLHGDNVSTVYGHVSGFAVSEGQLVTRGTIIGYTGGASGARGSGLSSGPHLHWEVRKNNIPINPRNYL